MRIGVKYCGGCNPRYDRTGLVARLQAALGAGVSWEKAAAEDTPDVVLVVCGCTAACAAHGALSGTHGKLLIRTSEQYDGALEWLRNIKLKDGGPVNGLENRL